MASPKKRAAEIAVSTTLRFLKENTSIEKVIFTAFDTENYTIYKKLLSK